MGRHYAYLHLRESDGQPFYVGKGCRARAWSDKGRNPLWHDVVAQHGWTVKLVDDDISEDQAYELEEFLVEFIGREILVNLTGGGWGGPSPSENTREKLRKAMMGRTYSPESIQKMRDAAKGNKKGVGRVVSPEVRARTSEKLKGHPVSAETRAKIAASSRAYIRDDAYRAKMSAAKTGFKMSEEAKAKISAARRAAVAAKKGNT
jgi:NUMOD3 motif